MDKQQHEPQDSEAPPASSAGTKEVLELLQQLKINPQHLSGEQTAQLKDALDTYAARQAGIERKPLLFTRIAMTLAGGGSLGMITALLAPSLLIAGATALAGGVAVWLAAERIGSDTPPGSDQPRHNGA